MTANSSSIELYIALSVFGNMTSGAHIQSFCNTNRKIKVTPREFLDGLVTQHHQTSKNEPRSIGVDLYSETRCHSHHHKCTRVCQLVQQPLRPQYTIYMCVYVGTNVCTFRCMPVSKIMLIL